MQYKVCDFQKYLNTDDIIYGSMDRYFTNVADKNNVKVDTLDWINSSNREPKKYLDNSKASIIIVPQKLQSYSDSFPFSKFSEETVFIISPDNPLDRERLAEKSKRYGLKYINLISPHANISRSSLLGTGIVIQYGCNVSSLTRIRDFVKINTYANIMHNVQIGDYTTVAPNAIILGFVNIGSKCYIGANSSILPRINICSDVIIGAGAVVTKDITEPGTYVGIPARKIK